MSIPPADEEADTLAVDLDDATAARIHEVGLATLRGEASSRLSSLKGELVDLINSDYAAFIGISTALRNYRPLPNNNDSLNDPIAAIKDALTASRNDLASMANEIKTMLDERAKLRDKKAALQTFLSIEESVGKLEGLLGVAQREDGKTSELDLNSSDDGKLVERVAIEYNQLLFLVSSAEKSGGSEVSVLKTLSWRIDRIKSALTSILKDTLETSLNAVSNPDRFDKTASSSLTQCLRTYLLVDRVKDAGVELRVIVSPAIEKIATTFCQTLDKFYAEVLLYISSRMSRILDISRQVFGTTGYDFLTDEIMVTVWSILSKYFHGAWNAGLPDSFHHNYLATTQFIDSIEKQYLHDVPGALLHFRKHPSTVEFLKRWNLEVYYRIRIKELVTSYDLVFESNILQVQLLAESPEGFKLQQSAALLSTLRNVWSNDKIYLPALISGFWKFSLQCLNRYHAWLQELAGSLGQTLKEINESSTTTTSIPTLNGTETNGASSPAVSTSSLAPVAPVAAQEDAIMLVVAAILGDLSLIAGVLTKFFDDSITERLPLGFPSTQVLKQQFLDAAHALQDVISEYQTKSASVLVKRCCVALDQVSVVVQRTGFSSNMPTSASAYVSKILAPASEFFARIPANPEEDPGSLKKWKILVIDGVSTRYHSIVGQQLEDVAKLDRYKSRRKGKDAVEGAVTAYDKIKQQMTMDIGQYKSEIETLVGEGAVVESLVSLNGLVGL
ncbi:hypothetical protein HDU79_002577 [Rhizoclosmatium sp. JEL0117]|nr:hypothetical protein HDU79_002577 [Rhizoclosmatium sp. JEL0117]